MRRTCTRGVVAQLLLGDVESAIDTLQAASTSGATGDTLFDLSAAYAAAAIGGLGDRTGAMALDAADRGLPTAPLNPQGLWNRFVALEFLGLVQQATEAADAYLSVDSESPWADEMRIRRERLQEMLYAV